MLALPDDPVTPLRGELSGDKRIAWAAPLDLAEIRTVGKALGCTVNDVLMAAIAGALGAHLREAHGIDTDELVLRASVPVDLRTPEETLTLGNKFGLLFVDLPVGTRHPLHRVFRLHDTTAALKRSLQPPVTLTVLGVLGLLPTAVQTSGIELFSRKGTLVASNVRGPDAPIYLCGQRIRELYFWVPQGGSMGIGVSILSYAGQVFFGIVADRNVLPEPSRLAERLGPEFEQLLLATTVGRLAVGRRRPAYAHGAKIAHAEPASDQTNCGKYLALGLTHCSKALASRRIRSRPTRRETCHAQPRHPPSSNARPQAAE